MQSCKPKALIHKPGSQQPETGGQLIDLQLNLQ